MNRFSYFGFEGIKITKRRMKQYKMNVDQYLELFASQIMDDPETFKNIAAPPDLFAPEMRFVRILLENKYTHYFINDYSLYRFLLNMKTEKEINILYALHEEVITGDVEIKVANHPSIPNDKGVIASGLIYLPDKNIRSVGFMIAKGSKYGNGIFYVSNGEVQACKPIIDEIVNFEHSINNNSTEPTKTMFHLVTNFLLYMKCFPDSILNSPPDDVKKQYAPYISRCFTIKTDESLIDRAGVTPHFRRGHFRVLRSEVFKKKRFQTVFVHSSFVKGHAKTVLDNADKEQMITV